MTHGTPRARRRAKTRAALLRTARQMVAEGGLDGLTMNGLARALDYTPGALYRYVDSRDALIVELQIEVMERWGRRLDAVAARCAEAAPDDALLPVLALGALFQELTVAEPSRFALVSSILGDPRQLLADEVAMPLVEPLVGLVRRVAALLEAAGLGGERPDRRAAVFLASLVGVLQIRKLGRLAPDLLAPGSFADDLVGALLAGWGAPAADLARAGDRLAGLPLLEAP